MWTKHELDERPERRKEEEIDPQTRDGGKNNKRRERGNLWMEIKSPAKSYYWFHKVHLFPTVEVPVRRKSIQVAEPGATVHNSVRKSRRGFSPRRVDTAAAPQFSTQFHLHCINAAFFTVFIPLCYWCSVQPVGRDGPGGCRSKWFNPFKMWHLIFGMRARQLTNRINQHRSWHRASVCRWKY